MIVHVVTVQEQVNPTDDVPMNAEPEVYVGTTLKAALLGLRAFIVENNDPEELDIVAHGNYQEVKALTADDEDRKLWGVLAKFLDYADYDMWEMSTDLLS